MVKLTASFFGVTDLIPTFDRGDRVRVMATVVDPVSNVLINPTNIRLYVNTPGPDEWNVVPQAQSTGVFYMLIDLNAEGTWRFRYEADGANEPLMLKVRPTQSD